MSVVSNPKPFNCWPVSLQVPGRPITFDSGRTALAAAAYIGRDRFELPRAKCVDFTKRGSDLVARIPILGRDTPRWTQSPFLRWKRADEASDRTGNPEDIRAWHVVADLPASATAGQWVDGVTEIVSLALTPWAVSDVALHARDGDVPAHAHIVAASRIPGEYAYESVDFDMHFCLDVALRLVWQEWVQEFADREVAPDGD